MPDLPSDTPSRLSAALEGRYRLERLLGQGGMATVWIAEDIRHQRKVAIKVLRADLSAALGSDRFLREIRIAAQLQHPHILGLIDSGEIAGHPERDGHPERSEGSLLYYVMPLVDGESLRERIDRQGPVPIPLTVRWLREVADALAKAHRAGIIHRDIKPDNILIADQHALVVDFGVARAVSDASPQSMLTGVGVTVGTPAYMAPEQVVADPGLDHRADLYSLGIVGYEMLAGIRPSPRDHRSSCSRPRSPSSRRRSRSARPDTPPGLAAIIMRLLAKEPAERYPDADTLVAQLESLGTGTHAIPVPSFPAPAAITQGGEGGSSAWRPASPSRWRSRCSRSALAHRSPRRPPTMGARSPSSRSPT